MDEWLLIDIDGGDVEFGRCTSTSPVRLTGRRKYESREFATATDCILRYAQDEGLQLHGIPTAVVMSGPVVRDTVRIARCPWIISIRGIAYLVGSNLVALNDSAAKAWADLEFGPATHKMIGGPTDVRTPDMPKDGDSYVAINFGRGLGASTLRMHGSDRVHVDTEMGHLLFAPVGPVERALAEALERRHRLVSWEHALIAGPSDPAWSTTTIRGDPRAINVARAGLLGSFCGEAVLAAGGWSGVLLHGAKADFSFDSEANSAFNTRFEARAGQASLIRSVPRWIAAAPYENLVGAAYCLQERLQRQTA